MALTNAFYEAVQSGNVRRVRIMMQDSLLVDPTFSEFNAMEKVAAAMTGLYDKHDGKEFIEDQTLWSVLWSSIFEMCIRDSPRPLDIFTRVSTLIFLSPRSIFP